MGRSLAGIPDSLGKLSAGVILALVFFVACGGTSARDGAGTAGTTGDAGASRGGAPANGGAATAGAGRGGSPATADGGATTGNAGMSASGGTTAGATAGGAGAVAEAGAGGGSEGLVSCDPRAILCKRAVPVCADGEVPSVEGTCYGPCVALERCACDEAADCPDENVGTCHMSSGHCGPYVR